MSIFAQRKNDLLATAVLPAVRAALAQETRNPEQAQSVPALTASSEAPKAAKRPKKPALSTSPLRELKAPCRQ